MIPFYDVDIFAIDFMRMCTLYSAHIESGVISMSRLNGQNCKIRQNLLPAHMYNKCIQVKCATRTTETNIKWTEEKRRNRVYARVCVYEQSAFVAHK